MFFGKRTFREPKKEGVPAALQRRIVFQVIFLVMVAGLLVVIVRHLDRKGDDLKPPVVKPALPVAADDRSPAAEGSDEAEHPEDELDVDVEIVEPVEPEAFVAKPEVLTGARNLETKGEVDLEALVYLLQKVRTDGEGFSASEPVLSGVRGDRVWNELMTRPDYYRGKLVEIRGNLVAPARGVSPLELDAELFLPWPNPAGVPSLYRAYIYDDRKFYVVTTWRKKREFHHMDAAVFRGYFCQTYAYDVEYKGSKTRARIPLIVGQDFKLLPPLVKEAPDLRPLFYLVIALPLVAVGFIVVLSWRTSRRTYPPRRTAFRSPRKPRKSHEESDSPSAEETAEEPHGQES